MMKESLKINMPVHSIFEDVSADDTRVFGAAADSEFNAGHMSWDPEVSALEVNDLTEVEIPFKVLTNLAFKF